MTIRSCRTAVAMAMMILAGAAHAQSPAPAPVPVPPFDVAYRAWEIVTQLARTRGEPGLSGECGRTFRPFVIPGLRRQSRQEEDVAASTCVQAARLACGNPRLPIAADLAHKCAEFR